MFVGSIKIRYQQIPVKLLNTILIDILKYIKHIILDLFSFQETQQ